MKLQLEQQVSIIQDCRTLCDHWHFLRYHRRKANEHAQAIRSICHSRGVHIGSLIRSVAIPILMLFCVTAMAAGASGVRTNVTLTSDYPTNELSTNLWFKVYSSTNLSASVTNWPLVAIVPGTNATFTLPIDTNQRFYVAKSSNSWWRIESDFSNIAGTPAIPRDLINLRLDFSAP